MPAAFVGIASAESGTEVTSLTVNVHPSTVDGHFMFLTYNKDDNVAGSVTATPDGWNRINAEFYWRIANDEPSSYTITTSLARRAIASISVWSGIAEIAAVSDIETGSSTGTSHTCPALSVPSGDYLLVAGVETNGGGVTFTPPAGFTEILDAETGGGGNEHVGATLAYKTYTGTTPPAVVFTSSGSLSDNYTFQLAFRVIGAPAAGVYIDFNDDGFEVGANDDVSTNVISWTIARGSGPEITGGSQPGSATLVTKNPSDIYNPYNGASPLTGLLRDGLPIWIGINNDGKLTGSSPIGLFGGRVTDITLLPAGGATDPPTAEFTCEDALGWYQRTPVALDYAEGRAHRALRKAALVNADEPRYSLAHEIETMPLSHAEGDLRGVLDEINGVNGTRHHAEPGTSADKWYRYTTRNRQWRLDATTDASLSATDDHVTGTDGWRLSADTVINQQKATVTPVVFTPSAFTVWEADQLPITVTNDAPYTRIVEFDDVVSGATLDIASTGDTVTSTLEPFATGAKITLTVAVGDEASVTALSIEGRLARRLEQQSTVSDDTTSQAAPRGIRAGGEIGNEYLGVMASAVGIAEHVIWRYGNPQLRPTLTVENWFPEMFELDLYDVISFTSTQLGMTARLFEIVGLRHQANIAATSVQHHTVTYVLQECKVQANPVWFYLNSGTNSSILDGATFNLAF